MAAVILVVGAVCFITLRARPPVARLMSARTRDPSLTCAGIKLSYAQTLRTHQSCQTDEECIAEPRSRLLASLVGCARIRRKDTDAAGLSEMEKLERLWTYRGCASVHSSCTSRAAQCTNGVCSEQPPAGLARDARRISVMETFSFYVPANSVERVVHPDDSFAGHFDLPDVSVTYDYGPYATHFEYLQGSSGLDDNRIVERSRLVVSGCEGDRTIIERRPFDGVPYFEIESFLPGRCPSRVIKFALSRSPAGILLRVRCGKLQDCLTAQPILDSLELD
jgi:hypothetical protein